MKPCFSFRNLVFALVLIVFAIGYSAFSQNQNRGKDSFRKQQLSKGNDSAASGKRSSDGAGWHLDQLDEQMKQLDIQMKNFDKQMENFDSQKFQDELNEVDFEKIDANIEKALKDIDIEKINKETAEKFTIENKTQMQELRQQMEKLKGDLQKQQFKISLGQKKMKMDIEKTLKGARKSLKGAKDELKNLKSFTDVLEKDGLIDKSKAYKIEVKDGELFINDKKQSKETSDKHRQFYKKGNITINMDEGDDIRI